MVENSEIKRSRVSIWVPTPDIFRVFSLIQIHCKDTFNDSFDEEFHALQASAVGIETIDFKTVENSEIEGSSVWIWMATEDIFPAFSHSNALQRDIQQIIRCRI